MGADQFTCFGIMGIPCQCAMTSQHDFERNMGTEFVLRSFTRSYLF